ncbi:MAG: alkaline phosphatase [Anaerolineales bacterium]|nr:MAG: alkaline phosphatase [Anaerolineales bacterium]
MYDILSILLLLASGAVIIIVVTIYINPTSKLYPFPPVSHDVATQSAVITPTPPPILPTDTAIPTQKPSPSATPSPTISASLTTTQTVTPTSVIFAVIGDYGLAGKAEADVADLVNSWNPDFILTTGDNNYLEGSSKNIDANIGQYYADYIFPYFGYYRTSATENRFFPSLGNHDWRTKNAQPYIDYFTLPGRERYYSFSFGPASFFALDSDINEPDGTSASSLQAQWLQLSLAASESVWNIVYFHHAPYSSGMHGSTEWMQWPFERWGASAVIGGHDHLYERLSIGGIPFFVNGSGGKSLYYFREPLLDSAVRYSSDYGAMLVEASQTSLLFRFINRSGQTIDEYTITRASPTPLPEPTPTEVQLTP